MRADAAERLDAAGERAAVEDRLLAWVAATVGVDAGDADEPVIRAAAAIAIRRSPEAAAAFLGAVDASWMRLGHVDELGVWYEAAARTTADPRHAYAAGDLAISCWRGDDARRRYRLAADLAERRGDVGMQARSLAAVVEMETRFWSTCTDVDDAVTRATIERAQVLAVGHPGAECLVLAATSFGNQGGGLPVVDGGAAECAALERAFAVAAELDDAVLMSTVLDALAARIQDQADPVRYEATHGRRVALLDRLAKHHRSTAEIEDILVNWAHAAIDLGRPDLAVERSWRALRHQSQQRLPHASLQSLVEAEYLLGRWDDALGHADQAVQVWEDDGRPPAAWLGPAVGLACAISIARGDDVGAARWTATLDDIRVSCGTAVRLYSADAHVADALDLVGRREEGLPLVRDPVETARWTYLSIRAGLLGGSAIDEARHWARGSAAATARWLRAAGQHDEAIALFTAMGSHWEAARTRLLVDRADAEARRVLAELGVVLPA